MENKKKPPSDRVNPMKRKQPTEDDKLANVQRHLLFIEKSIQSNDTPEWLERELHSICMKLAAEDKEFAPSYVPTSPDYSPTGSPCSPGPPTRE